MQSYHLGVNSREPSKHDEVYNIILPQWRENRKPEKNTVDEGTLHLKAFLDYYTELSQFNGESFLKEIRELPFLLYSTKQNPEKSFWGKAADIYRPTPDLERWFEPKPDTKFLLLDKYCARVWRKFKHVDLLGKIG